MDDEGSKEAVKRQKSPESTEDDGSSPKKFRREEFTFNVLDLSDEILLVILQNLDSTSLYSLSNTCLRFRNLVKEKKLWVNFDFQSEKLTAMELLKRMSFLNQETRTFKVRGLTSNYPFNSWDNPTITSNILTILIDSCPHLETLSVFEGFVNFNKINIQNFPSSLRRLELNKCEVPKPKMPQMFFHRIDSHMSHLEVLCLENSYWFETHDLVLFSKLPELRVLNLNGSNSMTHCVPYASIASRYGFKKLEVLDLRNTPVSDSDIQCFNITSTLKELLLECPRKLRDDVRFVNHPQCSSSSSSAATRKRRTSLHSIARLRGKKRPASDTEGSSSRSDRPQESTENDDEDSSSDSCTRTRPIKCVRTGNPSNEVISITLRCGQNHQQAGPSRTDQQCTACSGPSASAATASSTATVDAGEVASGPSSSSSAQNPNNPSSSAGPAPVGNPPLAPPPLNVRQVEIRQNGQSVRVNPIVIHNNNALGPIIIISGPPPQAYRTMRQMRIAVFKKKKKARKRRSGKVQRATDGTAGGAGGGGPSAGGNNADDSVEGDDEDEPDDGDGDDGEDGSEDDGSEYESGDSDEDPDDDDNDGNRPGFYTPSPSNLISDRGICSFGVSPNVMQNYVWIRAEPRNPNTSIERLVVRNYRQVTDTSLQHLKMCAPNLVYLDVSGTAVTKAAVEQFRLEKPECVVVADV